MSEHRGTLFGRTAELRTLLALLERAAAGRGGLALVTGEPGIGKTRLLEELATAGVARGFAVAWGRGWELGSAPTYWPWIEALRALYTRAGGREADTADLARLLPEVDARAKGRSAGEQRVSDAFELCDSVSAYLRAASVREPILLLLDDLHAADPSSLDLAEFVARQIRDTRLCLVASHRDVEARLTQGMEASLARLGRAGEQVVLGRFELVDVEALMREETGSSDSETARMIHATTEGNPLFVRELLRLIAARGAAGGNAVPAGVRAVIRERLALLTPATVALLQAAAVVGREFSLTVAATVAGVTPAALEDAAAEARAANLLTQDKPGLLRFSHALVAETLALDLPPKLRARLHRATAEVLERVHADDPAAPLGDIAHHWLEAGSEAAARAVDAALLAASAAIRRLAFADAASLYERALGALSVSAPADAPRRAEILVLEVEALAQSGERARAEKVCFVATDLAQGLGDGGLFARAALALGAEASIGKADPLVVRLLSEALALLPAGDSALRARVMARLASARQPAPDPRGPVALGRDAIAMARRLGDSAVLLPVVHAAMGALMDYAPAAERAPLNEEAARLAAAAGDRPRGLRAQMRLAFDRIELGDPAGFEQAVAGYAAIANEAPQPRYQWGTPMLHSMRAYWEGRFAEAEQLEDEARRIWDRAKVEGPPPAPMRKIGRALLRDDLDLLESALHDYLELYPDAAPLEPIFAAYAAAKRGRAPEASAHMKRLAVEFDEALADDVNALEFMTEIACCCGDAAWAERVYSRLLPQAGRPFMLTGIGFSLHGLVDHALLRVASLLGRHADADRHAAHALALCTRLGARPISASVRYDWALSLSERGDAESLSRARVLLRGARETAEALGMARRVELCRKLEQRLDAEAATTGTLAMAGALAPAAAGIVGDVAAALAPKLVELVELVIEGEYWTLKGFGELCRIRDGRGMQMLALLVRSPGREAHVFELSGVAGAVDGGDAGEVIDREARASYEARLRELRAEIEEAVAWNDVGRRERLEHEVEQLVSAISEATGLGGRERRTGSAAERARVNVRRRLALVLQRIENAAPKLGKHLSAAVRTGSYCVYDPRRE